MKTINGQTADAAIARLDAWRQAAAAKARGQDVDMLDAVIALVRGLFPADRVVAPTERGAAPAGTHVQPDQSEPECCPYSQLGQCAHCSLPGQLFVLPGYTGQVFQCLGDRDLSWRYRVDPRPYAPPPMTKDQADKQLDSLRAAEKRKRG
jgi:hypothetical protein